MKTFTRTSAPSWGVHLVQIGHDVGRKGMLDEAIISLLRAIRRPTLVSRDADFFDKSLCSRQYCLVWLDVRPDEVADYVRRLLRHANFKTWSQRRGRVVRVSATGITAWAIRAARARRYN
jgi:hypothetical protein